MASVLTSQIVGVLAVISSLHPCLVMAGRLQDLVILDDLLRKSYDRRATPTNHLNDTTPTRVYCELFVRSFGSPNPLTMDYKVDLYLRQWWQDDRLRHPDLKEDLDLSDPNLVKAIWKPEVYFPNAREADFQFVTVPNVLVRIHPGGKILYMLRLRVTFSCMMNLSKFPLDRQTCTMEMASFSKTVDELILEWTADSPVSYGSGGMSQFEIDGITTVKCPRESFVQIGNYSCLVAEFHLSRSIGFHLVQSYLPTVLMVAISWVSFWMDVNAVPGRVTLGVTTLLTVSSKSTTANFFQLFSLPPDIQENLPQASYIKAIDVWMGTCTGFVFLALLEFTVVNYLWRKEFHLLRGYPSAKENNQEIEENPCSPSPDDSEHNEMKVDSSENCLQPGFIRSSSKQPSLTGVECPTIFHTQASKCLKSDPNKVVVPPKPKCISARAIDETCRYAFPLGFLIFNFCYWPYYLFYPQQ